jgi:hypothetical protein
MELLLFGSAGSMLLGSFGYAEGVRRRIRPLRVAGATLALASPFALAIAVVAISLGGGS